jgi:hypothetical protein
MRISHVDLGMAQSLWNAFTRRSAYLFGGIRSEGSRIARCGESLHLHLWLQVSMTPHLRQSRMCWMFTLVEDYLMVSEEGIREKGTEMLFTDINSRAVRRRPPPRLSAKDVFEAMLRLDSTRRPGLPSNVFYELFARCDGCDLVMTRRVFQSHDCVTEDELEVIDLTIHSDN